MKLLKSFKLSKYDFEMLQGSDLMVTMIRNQIKLKTDNSQTTKNITNWCEEHASAFFYMRDEYGIITVYFESKDDLLKFKLTIPL